MTRIVTAEEIAGWFREETQRGRTPQAADCADMAAAVNELIANRGEISQVAAPLPTSRVPAATDIVLSAIDTWLTDHPPESTIHDLHARMTALRAELEAIRFAFMGRRPRRGRDGAPSGWDAAADLLAAHGMRAWRTAGHRPSTLGTTSPLLRVVVKSLEAAGIRMTPDAVVTSLRTHGYTLKWSLKQGDI